MLHHRFSSGFLRFFESDGTYLLSVHLHIDPVLALRLRRDVDTGALEDVTVLYEVCIGGAGALAQCSDGCPAATS